MTRPWKLNCLMGRLLRGFNGSVLVKEPDLFFALDRFEFG